MRNGPANNRVAILHEDGPAHLAELTGLEERPFMIPNMEDAQRFLDRLAPNREFTFQTFDDDKQRGDKRLTCLRNGSLEQLLQTLTSYQSSGAGVFVTINQTDGRGRKRSNITRIRAIHQDDDTGFQGTYPLDPHVVVETSPGKFQRIWLVEGTFEQHTRTMQAMVDRFGCDPNAKDLARVLRVPGFWHQKREPFLVTIVEMSQADPYPAEEFMRAFSVIDAPVSKKAVKRPVRAIQSSDLCAVHPDAPAVQTMP